jgi:hypothetical protein
VSDAKHKSIEISLGDWLFIDAQMDSAGALSRHEFDGELYNPQRAAQADAIREAGWETTGPITRPIAAAGLWPPRDEVMRTRVTVSLSIADWAFIVAELRRGSDGAADVGYPDDSVRATVLADRLDRTLSD